MFATPMEEYQVNPVSAKAINAFMILHMDHAACIEQVFAFQFDSPLPSFAHLLFVASLGGVLISEHQLPEIPRNRMHLPPQSALPAARRPAGVEMLLW